MTTLALAKHFPRSKGCEQQANTFFNCFSTATETFLSDTNKSSEQTKNTSRNSFVILLFDWLMLETAV